jgi:hypothetical protein
VQCACVCASRMQQAGGLGQRRVLQLNATAHLHAESNEQRRQLLAVSPLDLTCKRIVAITPSSASEMLRQHMLIHRTVGLTTSSTQPWASRCTSLIACMQFNMPQQHSK